MADQDKDEHLDEMLDSLLANYSSAEPGPGFETRILATVRSQRQKRKLTLGWIFASGLATGSAVVAIALNQRMTLPQPPASRRKRLFRRLSGPQRKPFEAPDVLSRRPRKFPLR